MTTTKTPLQTLRHRDCEARIRLEHSSEGCFYRIAFSRRVVAPSGVHHTPRFRGKDLSSLVHLAQEAELFLEGRYDARFEPASEAVDLDTAAGTDSRPPVPLDSIVAVVEYLDEEEGDDYRATSREDRPSHVYRDVIALRRWLRNSHRAALRPKPTLAAFLRRHCLDPAVYPSEHPLVNTPELLDRQVTNVVDGPCETRAIFVDGGVVIVETRFGCYLLS